MPHDLKYNAVPSDVRVATILGRGQFLDFIGLHHELHCKRDGLAHLKLFSVMDETDLLIP